MTKAVVVWMWARLRCWLGLHPMAQDWETGDGSMWESCLHCDYRTSPEFLTEMEAKIEQLGREYNEKWDAIIRTEEAQRYGPDHKKRGVEC